MVQPSVKPKDAPADSDLQPVLVPSQLEVNVPAELAVVGQASDVLGDLDESIEFALARGPRGVICDLTGIRQGADPGAVELLATAGRHVRDWRGIPVAVACTDPRVREALSTHLLGVHLIVTATMAEAVSAVLAAPAPTVELLQLAPHPTSAREGRHCITKIMLEWGLGLLVPSVCLVVSELVTNSTLHAKTDIEVSLAWIPGALRVAVQDGSPELPRQRYSQLDVHGRGLSVVIGLSRAFGVVPTADGGKVVWAVLDTATPYPPPSAGSRELVVTTS
jgi:hypothetical protein